MRSICSLPRSQDAAFSVIIASMTIYDFPSYRIYLKEITAERIRKNPSFSLRAMAKQLGLSPSSYSDVLQGRRNFSVKTAMRIATKIGLNDAEVEYFCLLVELESSSNMGRKSHLLNRARQLNPHRELESLDLDKFSAIAQWYHLAILTTMTLDNMVFNPQTVSEHLGLPKLEVDLALQRLQRIGLVAQDTSGNYLRKGGDILVTAPDISEAINRYTKEMLQKAADCLNVQKKNERILRTENIAIHESQLEEADQLVEEFFTKMARLTERAPTKNTVYHLGTQFFKISNPISKKVEEK
jgi:uncharacterized protein (TIGR02147 family)